MTTINRLRCVWGGAGLVGPGLSTFYFATTATDPADDVFAFLNAAPLLFPSSVSIFVPDNGDQIDDVTGTLVGTWSDPGTGGTVTGTNTGDFFMGVGFRVKWPTAGIVGGRRVVGSTFLCPIAAAISDTSGTIDTATLVSTAGAAAALVAAQPTMRIWSRPTPARAGTSSVVVSVEVPDKTSWLRSRRT